MFLEALMVAAMALCPGGSGDVPEDEGHTDTTVVARDVEICEMTMGDGSTQGTSELPCGDALANSDGITVRWEDGSTEDLRNCEFQGREDARCFLPDYSEADQTIYYTIIENGGYDDDNTGSGEND